MQQQQPNIGTKRAELWDAARSRLTVSTEWFLEDILFCIYTHV